jgi:sugar lactone lactonase YvrE
MGSTHPNTRRITTGLTAVATAAALGLGGAAPSATGSTASEPKPPTHIDLPDGFQPEGIATAKHHRGYFGSLADGDIYRLNLLTGKGKTISQGPGTPSVGLKLERRRSRLFVAGGSGGDARVIDVRTGHVLRSYRLSGAGGFINDVTLARGAAWFTDSFDNVLYRIPFGKHGKLPKQSKVEKVELTGEWEQLPEFNANGITTTPSHRALLVVNSASAKLFRVRPNGVAKEVDLRGAELTNGDGLLREDRTLYVVQNFLNQVAVVRLAKDGRRGSLHNTLTSDDFDIPTTIARAGSGLYLPNARFTTPATPDTPYWVTRLNVRR